MRFMGVTDVSILIKKIAFWDPSPKSGKNSIPPSRKCNWQNKIKVVIRTAAMLCGHYVYLEQSRRTNKTSRAVGTGNGFC